jgi:hypothetical protein
VNDINQTMNDTIKEPTQFDLNSIFISALSQAINQANAPLLARIAELEEKLKRHNDGIEERIKEIAEEVAEAAIYEHANEYDHDGYDRLEDKIDDAVAEMDLEDKVRDAMRNMTFSITARY